jgi:hypothetical protein
MHIRTFAEALHERRLEVRGAPVLFEQVSERFVSDFLEIHHTITRKQIERMPYLIVELNTLAAHPCATRAYYCTPSETPSLIAF